jgi:hypothetical protein
MKSDPLFVVFGIISFLGLISANYMEGEVYGSSTCVSENLEMYQIIKTSVCTPIPCTPLDLMSIQTRCVDVRPNPPLSKSENLYLQISSVGANDPDPEIVRSYSKIKL